jgi:ABC-2 type transport system permease protein
VSYILRTLFEEYRAILRDKGVLLIFLAGLAVYSLYYPLPYSQEVIRDVPVVAVDLDNSDISRKLMRWAQATEQVVFVHPTRDMAEARQRVINGDAAGILVIPRGFERDVLRGEQAAVSLYADACYFLIYRQIVTGLYSAAATLSAGIEIRRLTAAGLGEKHARMARDPVPLDTRPLFNPASGYATYVVPGVLVLIMQQTLLIGIGMLGGTRNESFADAPAPASGRPSYVALLIGRGAAYFSIYICYPIFYFAVVFRIFDFPRRGDMPTVLLFLVPFVLAVVFLGFALSALLRYREHSIPALIFTSMPAVFLMGFVWPNEAIPVWLRQIALLLPSTTGVVGFIRLNQMGASLHEVRFEWFTLWALCALYFSLAWIALHRRRPFRQRPHPDLP